MKKPRLAHQIFWGATWLNVANAVGMGMGFLQQIVLVRTMGLDQFGAMQIAMASFDVIVIFFDFNLYYSAIRYGGEALGRGDRDRYEQVFSAALQIKVALAAVLLLLSSGVWLTGITYEGQRLGIPFMLLSATYAWGSLLGYSTTIYNTDKRFGVVSFQNAGTAVLVGTGMMTGALLRGTMVSVLMGQTIATFAAATIALTFVRQRIFIRRVSRKILREIWVYAAQFAVSSVMKRILGKSDMLIVGYFLTARDAGLYRIAQSFASPIYAAVSPLWNVLFPIVSELSGKNDYGRIMSLLARGGRLLTVGALPLAAAGSIFLAPFLHIAYRIDNPEVVSTSVFLLWASALSVTATVFPPILRVFKNDIAVCYSIIATAFNLLLDLLLVPHIGILGCGISTFATVAAGTVFFYLYVHGFLASRTPVRHSLRYLLLYPAAAGLVITGFLGLHLLTAAGAVALVLTAITLRMITVTEIRQMVLDLKR